MTDDYAALMLQARFRQHKAWVNVRAIRLVRDEQERLTARGPNFTDPLGMSREGTMAPSANATRRWQPPKFSACAGVELDASMQLGAFEEDVGHDVHEGRHKLDFEYLLPAIVLRAESADDDKAGVGGDAERQGSTGHPRMGHRHSTRGHGRRRSSTLHLAAIARKGLNRLIEHWIFNTVVMILIVASTAVLCLDSAALTRAADAAKARGDLNSAPVVTLEVMGVLNWVFALLFTIEMLLKQIALGCKSYFCNAFNVLDFFCVVVSWITLMPGGDTLGALKSVRSLRALRPLRLITRIKSMAIVLDALMRALPAIGNVTLVLLIFWLVFAIIGVQIFGGSLSSCMLYVPPPLTGLVSGPGERLLLPLTALANQTICEAMRDDLEVAYDMGVISPGTLCHVDPSRSLPNATRCRLLWYEDVSGFQNVGQGLLTLMEVATLQG
jgi:hypothetical protein